MDPVNSVVVVVFLKCFPTRMNRIFFVLLFIFPDSLLFANEKYSLLCPTYMSLLFTCLNPNSGMWLNNRTSILCYMYVIF